jgi:hypothetical protein
MSVSTFNRSSQEVDVLPWRYDAAHLRPDVSSQNSEVVSKANATTEDLINSNHGHVREDSVSLPAYPGPIALALLMLGICLAAFLVALDRTIVATAIPQITNDFKTPGDIGWYGSAYLLTSCAFQPTYGRIFVHFDVRWSFLAALGLFELGSLVCGLAPSSTVLIVGRAIAGLGCAGVFAGVLVIITHSVPLVKRPIYMALVGSMYVHRLDSWVD